MPIRFGVSFPAWFSPDHKPTKPSEPNKPQKEYYETYSEIIDEFFFDGLSIKNLIETLEKYSTSDNFFLKNEKDCFITVYEEKKKLIILDDKEFEKRNKEYERKMKEYEKNYNEYLLRLKKYDGLLIQHESAKYTSLLAECEDQLEDINIEEYTNSLQKIDLVRKIEDCKKNLEKINEQKSKIIF